MGEIIKAIPAHCFERDTLKSLAYAALSTAMVAALGVLAYFYIPMQARPAVAMTNIGRAQTDMDSVSRRNNIYNCCFLS